jgi:MFS transporter, ACS family, tartrate transporter
VHKALVRLLPFVGVCMVFNYLDRVNVGYAALTMNEDLGLSSAAFGFGAGLFFIGYFFFEIPSNLALHRFGARVWIARIMVREIQDDPGEEACFGDVLVPTRAAGEGPVAVHTRGPRFVGPGRAGLDADPPERGGMVRLRCGVADDVLIEGLVPVVLGLLCLVFLPSRPVDARWLTRQEATALTRTLEAEARAP